MLSLDDDRWVNLTAGYRVPIDLRPLLQQLESARDPGTVWPELWQELYHQGDVGEGSYAAVPHLVRIHAARRSHDWNPYALVATIELARDTRENPAVPAWLEPAYTDSIVELASIGLEQLPTAESAEEVQSILSVLAIWKGARVYGRVLCEFTESEVEELEAQAFGPAV